MCKTRFSVGGKKISALHCEFMRQALGRSTVQSAALITSDVSHCLGLTCSEESWKRLAALSGLGADKDGGFWGCLSERNAAHCPVVHRCKRHEPKPTQYIDSNDSVSEDTQSPSDMLFLSGLISCVHPSYFRGKPITKQHSFVRTPPKHGPCPIICKEKGDAAIQPPQQCIFLLLSYLLLSNSGS